MSPTDSQIAKGVENRSVPAVVSPALRPKAVIAAVLVALPAILFYTILFRQISDIPYYDDYDALLVFLNQLSELKSISAKVSYFLGVQHNEYKLFFAQGLAWLQLTLLRHVDLKVLCALGNAFILALGILLWKMFLPNYKDLPSRLMLFIPVSWLLFQLQYVGTLNWAMPSLQNVPVVFFAFGAIYFLVRAGRGAFCGALAFLVLAIASSGNGFFVVPIGLLILAPGRRYARMAGWLAVSAACACAYAYHYDLNSSQSPTHFHQSILSALIRPRPRYVIAFLGSSAGSFPIKFGYHRLEVILCLFLGTALCLFFGWAAWKGYFRKNPLVCYCVLFLLLTAVGVAGIRSDFGIGQSLQSRYTIYSILLVIFAWFVIVEEWLQHENAPLLRKGVLLSAIAVAVLFSLAMDRAGWICLARRKSDLVEGIAGYEHPGTAGFAGPILPFPDQPATADDLDRRAPAILEESKKLGLYSPPVY